MYDKGFKRVVTITRPLHRLLAYIYKVYNHFTYFLVPTTTYWLLLVFCNNTSIIIIICKIGYYLMSSSMYYKIFSIIEFDYGV